MLREFCAENLTHIPAALAAGAARIELCDNLACGGTTPSAGVIWGAQRMAHEVGVRVMAMVRPRGGDFAYTHEELQVMEADLTSAVNLGADGVVFGCLQPADRAAYDAARHAAITAGRLPGFGYAAGWQLDFAACDRLCALVHDADATRDEPLDITFHMAFDELDARDQLEVIDVLATLGVTRILTHGGPAGTPIEANLEHLRELIAYADGRLTILPGAGITFENAEAIARELEAEELHGTRIVDLAHPPA